LVFRYIVLLAVRNMHTYSYLFLNIIFLPSEGKKNVYLALWPSESSEYLAAGSPVFLKFLDGALEAEED